MITSLPKKLFPKKTNAPLSTLQPHPPPLHIQMQEHLGPQ